MRQTNLKRTNRGYVRNLGKAPGGGQPKFYLGHNREEAIRRLDVITAMWERVEERTPPNTKQVPTWTDQEIQAAKQVARGESATLPSGPVRYFEDCVRYVHEIAEISQSTGVKFTPSVSKLYELGVEQINEKYEKALNDRTKAVFEVGTSLSGQTIHQALDAYGEYIDREYRDADGTVSDNGKTKLTQIKAIKNYLPDQDLAALDYQGTDELFGVFRRRPASKRYGTPMARKSCTNYIGELGRFFRWLHLSCQFQWRKPEDYDLIRRTPRELDDDTEKEAQDIPVWTIEQLAMLSKYATPIERIFLLLGLNCAYGADQAGRLRIGHLHLDGEVSFIRRIRRKKKTRSIHILWGQTADGLRWALERRRGQKAEGDFLLLTEKGQPYWRKTKGGNRANAIPRLWADLLKRVRVDHADFPLLPFNSLRDTSANMVRQLAGEEAASVHLAHKHQSKDENLGRYTNPIRKKHFKALRVLEWKLKAVFDAAGEEPWIRQPKSYMGKAKVEKLLELRRQGMSPREIAAKLDISVASVHRLAPSLAKPTASRKVTSPSNLAGGEKS